MLGDLTLQNSVYSAIGAVTFELTGGKSYVGTATSNIG